MNIQHNIIDMLKMDLAIREDNDIAGTGLGGNPSLLYTLLSSNIRWTECNKISATQYKQTNDIMFYLPKNEDQLKFDLVEGDLINLRNSLSATKKVSFDNLINIKWLESKNIKTFDWQCLIFAIKEATLIRNACNMAKPAYDAIQDLFKIKTENVIDSFFKEYPNFIRDNTIQWQNMLWCYNENLAETATEIVDVIKCNPKYNALLQDLHFKMNAAVESLISIEDMKAVNTLALAPMHIKCLAIKLISLELLVSFNLDEKLKLKNII